MLPHLSLRLIAAIGGGYVVASGAIALGAATLVAGRILPRDEAILLFSMLAFPAYLALILWAFAVRRLARLYATLTVAGAVCWGGSLMAARLGGG